MKIRTIALATAFALSGTFALCASRRRYGRRKSGGRRLRSHRQRDWLVYERHHDGKRGHYGHLAEQHPESVREYPWPQSLAERLNTDAYRLRLRPQ
jgi:hypothetical protein